MKKYILIGLVALSGFVGAVGSSYAAGQDFPADFDWMRVWYLQNNNVDICDPNVYPGFESDWGIAKPSDCLDGTAPKLTRQDVAGISLYTTVNGFREPTQFSLAKIFSNKTQQVAPTTQKAEDVKVTVELTEAEKKALEAQKESKPQEVKLSEAEKKALEALAEMNK